METACLAWLEPRGLSGSTKLAILAAALWSLEEWGAGQPRGVGATRDMAGGKQIFTRYNPSALVSAEWAPLPDCKQSSCMTVQGEGSTLGHPRSAPPALDPSQAGEAFVLGPSTALDCPRVSLGKSTKCRLRMTHHLQRAFQGPGLVLQV